MNREPSDLELQIARQARAAISETIIEHLGGYDSPLRKLVNDVAASRVDELRGQVTAALDAVLESGSFAEELEAALRQKLARTLVGKLGGEIEKRVNALRADATRRAQITLALGRMLDEIVGEGKKR